jgi:hypothetical protein
MKLGLREVNLVPAEGDNLTHPEGMPVGDQDHRGVPVPVPPFSLCGLYQALDFSRSQKFPAPALRVPRFSGRIFRTFPKRRIGGLKGDIDNPPVLPDPGPELSRKRPFSGVSLGWVKTIAGSGVVIGVVFFCAYIKLRPRSMQALVVRTVNILDEQETQARSPTVA